MNLGERMKANYENRTRYYLPRRTYTIIRIDGKAFHTFTRGMKKPFDPELITAFDETTKFLADNIQGCKLGYTQSDEINLLLTDFENDRTEAWFDGNIQKMASIAASMATAKFSQYFTKMAMFDARVFTIPDPVEVANYFIWRQRDAVRNSISSLAQSLYSPKELFKKNQSDMQEMCFFKGHNWNDLPVREKRGGLYVNKFVDCPIWTVENFSYESTRSSQRNQEPNCSDRIGRGA